ncbi:hypothetical protein EDC01DRAFT_76539 [Geopyxis carbonaria]|nr:hypothetical protein EDC01DRAFT_76539 [Geopyxis carbonaria]
MRHAQHDSERTGGFIRSGSRCSDHGLDGLELTMDKINNNVLYVDKDKTICRNASFSDVGKFLVFNYLIHAFTVISKPGETTSRSIGIGLLALLVPGVGLKRAAEVIYQAPILMRNGPRDTAKRGKRLLRWLNERGGNHNSGDFDYSEPLALAHAAGALCTIVSKDEIKTNNLDERDKVDPENTYIHGRYKLKANGQEFITRVPRHVKVRSLRVGGLASGDGYEQESVLELSNNTSLLKSLVAICQLLYSAWELYSARGAQLQTYGYAAYSLTTVPYALMSLVNLWATVLSPQYSCLFLVDREMPAESVLVESESLNQKKSTVSDHQGSIIHEEEVARDLEHGVVRSDSRALISNINERIAGSVGIIELDSPYDVSWPKKKARFDFREPPNRHTLHAAAMYIGIALFLAAPYLTIRGLTHFDRGTHSTHSQRVWIIMWITTGQIAALPFLEELMPTYKQKSAERWRKLFKFLRVCSLLSFVSAVGGYVVVVQMINSFGVCANV